MIRCIAVSHHLVLRNVWGPCGPRCLFQVTALKWNGLSTSNSHKSQETCNWVWLETTINGNLLCWSPEKYSPFWFQCHSRNSCNLNGMHILCLLCCNRKVFCPDLLSINCWHLPWNNATLSCSQLWLSFKPYTLVFGVRADPKEVKVWVFSYSSLRVNN